MNDPFVLKEVCDVKHKSVDTNIKEVKVALDELFTKINWFYIIAIATLASSVANLILK